MQAGALRDNGHRAVLIGDSNTYGKGKVGSPAERALAEVTVLHLQWVFL